MVLYCSVLKGVCLVFCFEGDREESGCGILMSRLRQKARATTLCHGRRLGWYLILVAGVIMFVASAEIKLRQFRKE